MDWAAGCRPDHDEGIGLRDDVHGQARLHQDHGARRTVEHGGPRADDAEVVLPRRDGRASLENEDQPLLVVRRTAHRLARLQAVDVARRVVPPGGGGIDPDDEPIGPGGGRAAEEAPRGSRSVNAHRGARPLRSRPGFWGVPAASLFMSPSTVGPVAPPVTRLAGGPSVPSGDRPPSSPRVGMFPNNRLSSIPADWPEVNPSASSRPPLSNRLHGPSCAHAGPASRASGEAWGRPAAQSERTGAPAAIASRMRTGPGASPGRWFLECFAGRLRGGASTSRPRCASGTSCSPQSGAA